MPIQGRNSGPPRVLLLVDAAWRLGPRPLASYFVHRLSHAAGLPRRRLRLRGPEGAPVPGAILAPHLPAPPRLPFTDLARLRAVLASLPPATWHGPFDPAAGALGMDLFRPGDVRPVWEANRLSWLPWLVQAARLWPEEGHGAELQSRLTEWQAANPPFQGPNWACGQEAALRALHMALALVLAGQAREPSLPAQGFLALHARRIGATRSYARAQDNNHGISEPAGLLVCAWLLGEEGRARRAARDLSAAVARLVAPDGGFAQLSTGYHRLLLDTLSVVEVLRRALGRPPLPAPFASRAAAAATWLARLVAENGAMPMLGHQDGSTLADLSVGGAGDARGSVERAMRLFAGRSAGFGEDAGCCWLGLATMPATPRELVWRGGGCLGWESAGARGLLRAGPLRFRPGQADLLHFELWDGSRPVLADAGTGAYNPPAEKAWWLDYFPSAAAHNTVTFDGREPMPRLSRFLLARWPRIRPLPSGEATGAALRDHHGNRHMRLVRPEGREWLVEDRVAGRFHELVLRWRLGSGKWRLMDGAVESEGARIAISADAPLTLSLETGWESPAYGEARPCPVLVARAAAPVRRLLTRIALR
ncbi:heparinase II/III-family protein [Pseudoroseomonas globiformis]|uniref:Heparinase II/III-family protein n=1 Tax=Teichococcus globiformis TaxID=2307229 RepID=A0ABV7G116_9PROT